MPVRENGLRTSDRELGKGEAMTPWSGSVAPAAGIPVDVALQAYHLPRDGQPHRPSPVPSGFWHFLHQFAGFGIERGGGGGEQVARWGLLLARRVRIYHRGVLKLNLCLSLARDDACS